MHKDKSAQGNKSGNDWNFIFKHRSTSTSKSNFSPLCIPLGRLRIPSLDILQTRAFVLPKVNPIQFNPQYFPFVRLNVSDFQFNDGNKTKLDDFLRNCHFSPPISLVTTPENKILGNYSKHVTPRCLIYCLSCRFYNLFYNENVRNLHGRILHRHLSINQGFAQQQIRYSVSLYFINSYNYILLQQ